MKTFKRVLLALFLIGMVLAGYAAWILMGSKTSNPNNYKTIGDISTPWGYERLEGDDPAYSRFLRSLPLRGKGTEVMLFTGGTSRFQSLNYAVIDIPLLSNDEQCADACMRLRAEYLFQTGQYSHIHFRDVNGHTLNYSGGASRKAFNSYLRRVYGLASTYSLSREMKQRPLAEMQPGDVFVYAAVDRPGNHKYGHAIMVVDVAINKYGKKAFLLAEGNTPARDFHILRNFENPFRSPWFFLDEDADVMLLAVFPYQSNELRHF